MAAAEGLPVIPHAGQAHNYHLVTSHLNSPMAEYFPPPDQGGVLDDDTIFYEFRWGTPGDIRLCDTVNGTRPRA